MRIPGLQRAMLNRLLQIVKELYAETEQFLEQPEDQQLWYQLASEQEDEDLLPVFEQRLLKPAPLGAGSSQGIIVR